MNIFFIRHGESEHNKFLRDAREAKKLGTEMPVRTSTRDLPLTEEGRDHIVRSFEKLPDHIDAFYCSDHIRTKQSADLIQEKYLDHPYIIDKRINASSCGTLDHCSLDEISEIIGADFEKQIESDSFDFRPWGGESAPDVHKRVENFLTEICKKDFEDVLVVTSLEVIKSVYKILFGETAPDIIKYIRAKNGSVHRFNINSSDIKTPHQ